MHITIFGSGYVGLVTGACMAEMGNHVVCVDIDADKIQRLNAGEVPIYEPGLNDYIKRNMEAGRLEFTTDVAKGAGHGLFQFIAVGIGIVAVFPVINYLIARNEVSFPPPSLDSPLQLDGWIHSEADSATLGIRFDGAQSSLTVRFQDGTDSVMFYANIYGKQTQGAELVGDNNNIYDRSQWRVVSKDRTDFGAAAVSGMFLTLSNRAGKRRILYYWYVVNGEAFVDPMIVKMREVLSRFSGTSSSGIRVVTRGCSAKCESSRKIVETFIREHGRELSLLWVPSG